jgi:hypothetical protein
MQEATSIIVALITWITLLQIQVHGTQMSFISREADTIIVIFDRENDLNRKTNLLGNDWAYTRGGFEDPSLSVGVTHVASSGQACAYLPSTQLLEIPIIYDNDLTFDDWVELKGKSEAGTTMLLVFKDSWMHKDRFVLGLKVPACEEDIQIWGIE